MGFLNLVSCIVISSFIYERSSQNFIYDMRQYWKNLVSSFFKCEKRVWYSPSSSLEAQIWWTHFVLFVLFSFSHSAARDSTKTSSSLLRGESLILGWYEVRLSAAKANLLLPRITSLASIHLGSGLKRLLWCAHSASVLICSEASKGSAAVPVWTSVQQA